ncbi:hypothetical protein ABZ942_15485 [Nocardia sp. NPDC046473]|uniref:hypothetical protein n=1 Tax=Nocardia sp. NPDC046473 TaxID=3155733 RepID=UPI0033DE726E
MSGSEVDDISAETRRFTGALSGAWWQLREKFSRTEAAQQHKRHTVLHQQKQLRAVTAERDQLLIEMAEVKQDLEISVMLEQKRRDELDKLQLEHMQLSSEYERSATLCETFEKERDQLAHELEGARAELNQARQAPTQWDREYEEITAFQEAQYVPAFEEDTFDDQVVDRDGWRVAESVDERSAVPEMVDDAGELKPPRMEA